MLFEFPFHQSKPIDYPQDRKQPLTHQIGFGQITSLEFTLPSRNALSASLEKVINHSCIQIAEGLHYHVSIEFDYGINRANESFSKVMPLTFKW